MLIKWNIQPKIISYCQNLYLHSNSAHGNVAGEALAYCLSESAKLFHPCTTEKKQSKYTRLFIQCEFGPICSLVTVAKICEGFGLGNYPCNYFVIKREPKPDQS